jgi:hypothetical protein
MRTQELAPRVLIAAKSGAPERVLETADLRALVG